MRKIYKFKAWLKSRLIASYSATMTVVAVLIVVIMATCFTLFSPYFAKIQLSSKINNVSNDLIDNYSSTIGDYQSFIKSVVSNIDFDCGVNDKTYIEKKSYNNYYIRNIDIATNNKKYCSSFDGNRHEYESDSVFIKKINKNLSLWAILNDKNEQSILSLVWKDERGQVSIDFEPIISDVIRNKYCDDCILSVVSTVGNADKKISSHNDVKNLSSLPPLNTEVFNNGLILRNYVDPQLLSLISIDLKPLLFIVGVFFGLIIFLFINLYIKRQLSLHSLIVKGVIRKEFIPYYQPIINVKNNTMYGCEVLVRWWFNKKELISPDDFIPYAENSGLIIDITDVLLEKTLTQLSSLNWQKSTAVISINLVPEQLENKQQIRKFVDMIIKSSISPKQIAFEITERMSFTDLDKAAIVIDYLKAQGINVKLDDAGTGYGSFSYIQHLNLQSLKIDKMFVDTIGTYDHKLFVLDSIIAFGKKAGMEMIAEGVETKQQSDYLLQSGVYLQQGFYFSEPLKFEQFRHYFQRDQAKI
ncbi:EAL domain-containing protein [Photobacterium kishitanii]|uniref:EAL domain-containing protein n=1 Tax=Photobacterium kishitanii TaxID=318456 RepID=UPI0004318170|nr:EAL domain-containing protein [Photobacterium kishitanii]PSU90517.1 EAL domain-containing protein [Photobacterium kishitanii]PSW68203.1 EAL domain-containing protein [Photobacterium kishitanii]CEO40860.1 EAL domain protein [Photobacterium kishitanii]